MSSMEVSDVDVDNGEEKDYYVTPDTWMRFKTGVDQGFVIHYPTDSDDRDNMDYIDVTDDDDNAIATIYIMREPYRSVTFENNSIYLNPYNDGSGLKLSTQIFWAKYHDEDTEDYNDYLWWWWAYPVVGTTSSLPDTLWNVSDEVEGWWAPYPLEKGDTNRLAFPIHGVQYYQVSEDSDGEIAGAYVWNMWVTIVLMEGDGDTACQYQNSYLITVVEPPETGVTQIEFRWMPDKVWERLQTAESYLPSND